MSPLAARSALLALALLASCAKPPDSRLAAYRTPPVPPECRQAVYRDPEVRRLIAAGAAVPTLMAENQNQLAFAEAEAERKCMERKGLIRGGVEPVRYTWYPSLF